MGLTLATLFFFALVLTWIVLPFLPALREMRERRDVEPLRVVRDSEVDVVHFARGFRRYVDQRLGQEWARGRRDGGRIEGTLPDRTDYVVLGRDRAGTVGLDGLKVKPCKAVLLACGDLALPEQGVYLLEVFAEGRISGGERSLYRAVLAEGDLELGADSQVLRWAHSAGSVTAGEGCELFGRLSAGREIRLGDGCRFERLHAPRIVFGRNDDPPRPTVVPTRFEHSDLPGVTDVAAGRWRIRGDLSLPEGARVEADLVILGRARFGDGAEVRGSIKTHGELVLGRGVEVFGSVVSQSNVVIGEGCRIHGPVISERGVWLASGSRIGTPDQQTTVSASTLVAAPGAIAHGTVWSHARGEVRETRASSRSGAVGRAGEAGGRGSAA